MKSFLKSYLSIVLFLVGQCVFTLLKLEGVQYMGIPLLLCGVVFMYGIYLRIQDKKTTAN